MATSTEAPQRPPEARLVDDLRGGLDDLKRLAIMEVDLAKLEAGTAIKRVLIAAGLVVGALIFLYAAFIYAIGSLADGVGLLDHFWGWLIVAAALVAVALGLAFIAYRLAMKAKDEALGTFQSIKGDVEWLRQLATQRSSGS